LTAPADSLPASVSEPGLDADSLLTRKPLVPTFIYWGLHALCLAVFVVGISKGALVLAAATFWLRLFAITGGYHRYFAHRAFRTSRTFQFVLAFLGASATQKGPLWWAGGHRRHHKYSDLPGDMHSPRDGFWYSHQGWILDTRWEDTELDRIRDFAKFPELVWLNRWHFVPPLLLAALCAAIGGWSGVIWGFVVSTVALWHTTYSINSLAHRWGSRRYDTTDTSRNNWVLALLTLGEGWHNNHHWYMTSARQGFFWWEVDITYYALRALALVGLVWDLREVPDEVRRAATGATPLESSPS
jgi:stearoyl-CoA desaturase (delta-9 desaturase)